MQAYISRKHCNTFSLVSDMAYVAQNSSRILRALFELCLRRSQPIAMQFLELCKCVEKRQWPFETPLRQFEGKIKPELIMKVESNKVDLNKIRDLSSNELGGVIRNVRAGSSLKAMASHIPQINISCEVNIKHNRNHKP